VVRRTSQAGAVVHEYRYDAWGQIEVGATEPGYAFTGREWDPEIELHYYRARYDDPKIGRFIGEDPIGFGDGPNRYLYVQASPTNAVDPSGLSTMGMGGTVINLSKCCALTSSNNPEGPGQKQYWVPPKSTRGPLGDVDAICFKDGSAIKIPDFAIYVVIDCSALEKWNGSVPPLNGRIPRYRVVFLPDKKAQEKEFGGPILPPEPNAACCE
jgi:RHS repeat-associated protein